MLFTSIDFAIFLPIIFILYWYVTSYNLQLQNFLIVIASYVFYGWWDWHFLTMIFLSTVLDYCIGVRMSSMENHKKRKLLLWTSIIINLGFLFYFKYSNFFLENFVAAFSFFGQPINYTSLKIVLPVGISFYTFQTLSYSIDVYKRRLQPTKDFVAFAAFVSFFPQLVAGPIERATHLLPQFYSKRHFDYQKAVDGMRQILWGLFKKMVIADNCAVFANDIFNNPNYSGSTLALGALFFTIQIYCDFSGYSDIAVGTSRLFGFDLMQNFAFPYFSRDIAEFWRRWHISLSTWFRDYVYIPLGGSKGDIWMKVRNIFIIFLLSGFWHGAKWTYVIWGLINAIYFLPLFLLNHNRNNLEVVAKGRMLPTFKELFQIISTFCLTILAWIFFRANDLNHAFTMISTIFSKSIVEPINFSTMKAINLLVLPCVVIFFIIEWAGRESKYAIENFGTKWNFAFRWSFYFIIIISLFIFSSKEKEFIYFQF